MTRSRLLITRMVALLLLGVLAASCAAPAALASAPPPSRTAASSSLAPTTPATVLPSPVFAASECTNATATTRQVIERYFALSTSNNAAAVTDCFAKVWRDRNATGVNATTFADSAALWSNSGPATNLVITFVDAVNGCDRFRVSARMPPDSFWMRGQSGESAFFSMGAERGRMRIYETSSALTNASNTALRCG